MDDRVCAQKAPYRVELTSGDYYWCACGRSKSQPLCDGSHKGTGHAPVKFTLTEAKQVHLCGCKQTKKEPFCDGTHKAI